MLGNRYAQHSFAQVPDVHMVRSQFDRSHTVKDTMNFDYLTPIFVDEILPGDTCNLTLNTFIRLSTFALKTPVMDNMYVDFFFFFVPNRLVWDNWEKFNGAQDNPGDSTSFVIPTITSTNTTDFAVGTIYDHLGIPTGISGIVINALPLRAINLIWNTWFRDENLQNSITVNKGNGPDTPGTYTMLKRNRRPDYFTTALPSPQKGTAVTLPLGTTAPIAAVGADGNTLGIRTGLAGAGGTRRIGADTTVAYITTGTPDVMMVADLSGATAATINQFRQAIMVQSLLELDSRGGTRYVEILQAHFNVISPDFRLQRPEYLGGGEVVINSHPVAQTSPTSGTNAQGSLAAFGTASSQGRNIGFTKSFVEHGYVIGFAAARADITYQQGLNRMWSRSTRYDFFWPKLQEMGEQSVYLGEIYAQGTSADLGTVWGYQERYGEYKQKPSEIRGQFRSTYSTPLDYWHMAEKFASAPSLNSTFIPSSTPVDRALAVTTGPQLLCDFWFNYKHSRPMLSYAVPASLGRF